MASPTPDVMQQIRAYWAECWQLQRRPAPVYVVVNRVNGDFLSWSVNRVMVIGRVRATPGTTFAVLRMEILP